MFAFGKDEISSVKLMYEISNFDFLFNLLWNLKILYSIEIL